jgi:16S rRNA (guanine527-N7)-methyltransferase
MRPPEADRTLAMQEWSLDATHVSARLRAAGVERDAASTAQLTLYLNLVGRWNRVYNLTGSRGADELIDRHLVESLALQPLLHGARVADVGSGAGFPGIPLAICEPQRNFTLIESRAKRVNFLRHVAATLQLRNAGVAKTRAEDLRAEPPFATVLARAVARPAKLLEIVKPLMANGSILLLLTSSVLAKSLEEPPAGFVLRPVSLDVRLPSAVVMLERSHERRRG